MQIIRSVCQCSGCALRLAATLEAAAGEIQIPFLSAQPGLAAKILGLFKRLMAKERMRESSRMALNPGSPTSPSSSSAEQGIYSPCSLFLT